VRFRIDLLSRAYPHTDFPSDSLSLGGELPRDYSHTIDPIVAMTMAASATQNLKVATGICLVIERDPIVLTKGVASSIKLQR